MKHPNYKLRKLVPVLIRINNTGGHVAVESMKDAQGIRFLCPKCYYENGGPMGTHQVICWFHGRGVPDDAPPGPGRWVAKGAGIDDLTLDAPPGKTRSVRLLGGCRWHGFVTGGSVDEA